MAGQGRVGSDLRDECSSDQAFTDPCCAGVTSAPIGRWRRAGAPAALHPPPRQLSASYSRASMVCATHGQLRADRRPRDELADARLGDQLVVMYDDVTAKEDDLRRSDDR